MPSLFEEDADNLSNIPILLAGIDKVCFYKSVSSGDRFEICAKIERIAMGIATASATASATGRVNNETVSECKINYKIIGRE